jgi:hypothetical protein
MMRDVRGQIKEVANAAYDRTYRLIREATPGHVHGLVFKRVHREVFMPVRVRAYEQIMRELLEDLTIP